MKPLIWEDGKKEDEVKPVMLRLVIEDGHVSLGAVDQNGDFVANLISFSHIGKARLSMRAKDCLAHDGYDTSFCEWDDRGRMVLS